MKIEIYSNYGVSVTTDTTLTIPQLRRIDRRGDLSVTGGRVLIAAGRGSDAEHAAYYVHRLQQLIRFAGVTGLVPSDAGRKTWNLRHNHHQILGSAFDHDLVWRAPNGAVVYTNEPYHTEAFLEWIKHTGWKYAEVPQAAGLYGVGSYMFITTDDASVDLTGMAAAWGAAA